MNALRLLLAAALGLALPALAQKLVLPGGYPDRAIRLIVGAAPGGGADILARLVSPRLSERWSTPVIVENRPSGLGGIIGMEAVAKSPPDGYTLLLAASSSVLNSVMVTRTSFDVRRDFAPVAQLTAQPWILSVPATLPANSVQALIAYARSRPGQLNYTSSGTGSAAHLGMEMFNIVTGTKITHIPYKGIGPGLLDMIAGRVQMLLATPAATVPHLRSGKIRALAVTSATRFALLPDVPTLAESGLPDFDVSGWFGVFAPAATPAPIVAALNREMVDILRQPDMQAKLRSDGSLPTPVSPETFRASMLRELGRWEKVIKSTNLKLDTN
jgi:tripartite-type tricarboxylate transporter receptor subunit TctC